MNLNIVGFFKSLLPSLDKSNIEADMEISLDAISTVIEVYKNFEAMEKASGFVAKQSKEKIKIFYQEVKNGDTKIKLTNKYIGSDMVTLFTNLKVNGDWLLREIDDTVNDVIVSRALTAYKASLLRSVDHFYFLVRFGLDFANYLYIQEAHEAGADIPGEGKLNKKQLEFIEKNLWIFARILGCYGSDHDSFVKNVGRAKEINLQQDQIDEIIATYKPNDVDILTNIPQGFIGSPIYSIRLVFAQWEADRYRNLKDKKKLLELRYLHLKLMKEQGQQDAAMEKEIVYLQKKLTDIDYKLSKIEESVND